jgi:hypothetical protein
VQLARGLRETSGLRKGGEGAELSGIQWLGHE